MSEFRGLWIPAEMIDAKGILTFIEKGFISQIIALSQDGECTATNEYFANFFELRKETVSRILSSLQERGWIKITINKGEGNKRGICENVNTLLTQTHIPIDANAYTLLTQTHIPICENVNSLYKVENKSKTKIKTNLKQTIKGKFQKIGETAGEILATQQVDGNTAKKIELELHAENRTQPTNEKKEKEKIYRGAENSSDGYAEALKPTLADMAAEYVHEFGEDTIQDFLNHWTEKSLNGKKQRWEMERTWDLHLRLVKWKRNEINWGTKNKNKSKVYGQPNYDYGEFKAAIRANNQ